MNLVLLVQQVMDYSFTPCLTLLRSAGCCVCGVANREVSKCLLEDNYVTSTLITWLMAFPPISSILFKFSFIGYYKITSAYCSMRYGNQNLKKIGDLVIKRIISLNEAQGETRVI